MESFTLTRSGQAPLMFEGTQIAECSGSEIVREPTRWHDLTIYRTAGGRYVVAVSYVCVVKGPEEVARALAHYDPAEHVAGYPEGEAYRARQQSLLADIRARYGQQVSRVLAVAGEEFAERVE